MKCQKCWWIVATVGSALLACSTAQAQVPPHYPGTICFTPQLWCWMTQPGPVGGMCYCPSPYGPIQGRLG